MHIEQYQQAVSDLLTKAGEQPVEHEEAQYYRNLDRTPEQACRDVIHKRQHAKARAGQAQAGQAA